MSLNEPLIKDVPPQRIVGKKGTGPYGETISRLMPALCGQIFSEENQKNGLKVTGPFMTLYHDCEYREKDATMECVAPITGRIVLSDPDMEVRTLPGGKVLSLIHKGSYNTAPRSVEPDRCLCRGTGVCPERAPPRSVSQ